MKVKTLFDITKNLSKVLDVIKEEIKNDEFLSLEKFLKADIIFKPDVEVICFVFGADIEIGWNYIYRSYSKVFIVKKDGEIIKDYKGLDSYIYYGEEVVNDKKEKNNDKSIKGWIKAKGIKMEDILYVIIYELGYEKAKGNNTYKTWNKLTITTIKKGGNDK